VDTPVALTAAMSVTAAAILRGQRARTAIR